MKKEIISIPIEIIGNKIYIIRGKKIMLDFNLAEMYETETRLLNEAVRRNIDRFPDDFMFLLSEKEESSLISQFAISKKGKGGRRKPLLAFTEQGVAMLSSVLKSKRAIQVNIQIMRTFTKLREFLITHEELRDKIVEIEEKYDGQFKTVFEAIQRLVMPEEEESTKKMGYQME